MSNVGPYVQSMQDQARDAARYRWLRSRRDVTLITMFFGNGCVNKTIEMAEAKLDEAMAADAGRAR
jgi:hypothetical protein